MNGRTLAAMIVLVVAAAIWWWPTDRRRIVAATQQLAETMSMPSSEPELARVTRAATLSRLLASGFRLVDARGRILVDGRDTAIGFATKLQPPRGLQVSVGELELEIDGAGGTARAQTVLTLREPGAAGSPDSVETRAVVLDWTRGDAWALSSVTIDPDEGSGRQGFQ